MKQQPRVSAAELDAYQAETMTRSSQRREPKPLAYRVFYGLSSLAGEAGELFGVVKKAAFHGSPLDLERLADEAGDVLWYCAYVADAYGAKLSDVVEPYQGMFEADFAPISGVAPEALREPRVLHETATFARVMAVAGEALAIPPAFDDSVVYHGDAILKRIARIVSLVACGLEFAGTSITAALVANQAKLAARYPNGYNRADYAAKEEGRAPAGGAPWASRA